MAGNGRLLIAVGLIAVMVVALVVLLRDDGEVVVAETSTTTIPTTTSTTLAPTTTTTAPSATTTTSIDPDVRLAEVEQILEELELARLVAIHDKNEVALPGIIAIRAGIDDAVEAFNSLTFEGDPAEVGIRIEVLDVLLDRPDCLVVYHQFDGREALGSEAVETAVRILWPRTEGESDYRLARLWSIAKEKLRSWPFPY